MDLSTKKHRYWSKRSPISSEDTKYSVHFSDNIMLLELSHVSHGKHNLYLFKDDNFLKELNLVTRTYNPYQYPVNFSCMLEHESIVVAYQDKIELMDLDFNVT